MAKRKQQRNNGRRYSEADKQVAREIVRVGGGAVTDELLKQVRTVLRADSISWGTLATWCSVKVEAASTKTSTAESRVRSSAEVETVEINYYEAATREIVERTFRQYAKRANDSTAVEKTEGKDAARVMADMAKLMQLLDGKPTEIIEAMPALTRFAEVLRQDGRSLGDAIEIQLNEYIAEQARLKTEQVQNNVENDNFQGGNR